MPSVLVVYGLMQHPLRSTVEDHLYALRRHSRARCFYVNATIGPVPRWMRSVPFDAIVFHTSFLSSMRWAGRSSPRRCASGRSRCATPRRVRAAMPQDEFLRSDDLCAFIRDAGIDVVFSVSPASEWPKIYAGVDRERVRFEPVLTGYLDDRTVAASTRSWPGRASGGTTSSTAPAPSGRTWGATGCSRPGSREAGEAEARRRGLTTDISIAPGDTLLGDDWFRALAASRWTLGVEGGASILDRDGTIRAATERYAREHPDAGFDEVEAACFPGRDGELSLFALSPRHLEACATRTGQILVDGGYSGVLEPGRHYLALRPDLSNLEEVLDEARDERRRQELTAAAYRDVVASGRYTYRGFVAQVDDVLLAGAAPARRGSPGRATGDEWPARVHDRWRGRASRGACGAAQVRARLLRRASRLRRSSTPR